MNEKNIISSGVKSEIDDSNSIESKANCKNHGNKLMKSEEYDDAEDFYIGLISNMYFLNDYYPFRKLVQVYIKKDEPENVITTIEDFFNSERYCSGYQLLWFKFKYRKACKKTGDQFDKFEECLDYFNEHGLKNKDKQNDPVPIAARIKTSGKKVKIISQDSHDKKIEYEELRLRSKYAYNYESREKALFYMEQLWKRKEFKKKYGDYRKLCSLYFDTGRYEKVIDVAEEFFNSNVPKLDSRISWFDKKVSKARKKLDKLPVQKTLLKSVETMVISNDKVNSTETDISNNFNEKSPDNPVITVSRNNFTKLLSSKVGDEINIKRGRNSIKLEIIRISNPYHMLMEVEDNVKINISAENYKIVENLSDDGVLSVKHKNYPGQIDLKLFTQDIRKKLNEFIRDLVETRSITKSCNNLNISSEEFDSWISKDKWDVEPYASFQNIVQDIIWSEDSDNTINSVISSESLQISENSDNIDYDDGILGNEEISLKLDEVIKDLEKTKDIHQTRNNLNISSEEFNSWISKDKSNVEPYASFIRKFERIFLADTERHQFPHAIKNKHKKRKSKNQRHSREKVKEKVLTRFVNNYFSHSCLTPDAYLNEQHLRLMKFATECIENNELDNAMNYYDEILNQYPNFEVLNKKGFLLIQLEEFEKAIDCFDNSLVYQMKNNFDAHVGKSLAIFNLLKLYECNADQIDWDNKFERMMNHCHVACLIDIEGYIFKANILNGLGQYAGAIGAIDEMFNKETLEINLYYSALLEKSFSFRQLGKYHLAIDCYDELLKLDNKNVNVLVNKAEVFFILENYEDSISAFNSVLKSDPKNINALMYLGIINLNFNNFEEALLNFDKILEIDDSFYNALIFKAKLLVDLHRYSEAVDCFNKCGDDLSADYQKLFKFAKEESLQNNQTDYYAVTKTDFANFKYVYTYFDNGLRKIYGENLSDLKIKVINKHKLWMNIHNERFSEIQVSNENQDFVKKCIHDYYIYDSSDYEGLLSLIINNEFLENLDLNNLDLTELLSSKSDIEKDIIIDLILTMNDKLNFVHNENTTGYYGVIVQNKSNGIRWSYLDLVKREYCYSKVIYAKTLDELEEKVKLANSLWYVFDELLAEESQKRDLR